MRYGGLTAVAAIAAIISYRHMSGLLAAYGEEGIGATLGPLAVDGLMVVSSGALMAVAHNRRLAARAEDAPEAARDLSPLRVQDAPAVPSQEPPEQVPEGGADLGPDIDLSGLVEALRELQADGGVSGKKLAAAMERRGVKVDERAARAALAMLRPSNPSSNGDDMSPGPTDSPIRERIRAAEPATA